MKTRCPECQTEYPLVPAALKATQGVARCAKCGHIFNAFDYRISRSEARQPPMDNRSAASRQPTASQTMAAHDNVDTAPPQPMFADETTRRPVPSAFGAPIWQIALLVLLVVLLLGQFLWINRANLAGTPLCEWFDCSVAQQRAPTSFQVIEREIRHDPNRHDLLYFNLRFRNDAAFAQPLPDLMLHLFDNNEYLVVRRRLYPADYSPDRPTGGAGMQPGEIIQIKLAFMDPGAHASGFKIDFL